MTNCIEKMADTGGELNPPKKMDAREKLRVVRERQAEERQRRLEELKKHALEAQQLREQKEIERKKRMEDLRQKENEKRSQVEERKKQIWEAERERREAILRKNQEREARIESKRKNERSSIVFAFGSSTPRLLETMDSCNTFWGPRRATSTANLRLFPTTTSQNLPLSRRSSERELEPKKRASSAGGLYRNPSDLMSSSMYEVFHWDTEPPRPRLSLAPIDPYLSNIDDNSAISHISRQSKSFHNSHVIAGDSEDNPVMSTSQIRIGRRKTDLMPVIPSPREGTNSRPTSGTRSLARTPGRAYSMARLDILAQPRVVHTNTFSQPLSAPSKSMSRSTNHLVESKLFQSNNLVKKDTSKSMVQLHSKGSSLNFIQPRLTRAQRLRNRARAAASAKSVSPDGGLSSGETTPSRPGSVLSQCSFTSASSTNPTPAPRMRATPRRPRPFSIHITGVSKDKDVQKMGSPSEEKSKTKEIKVTKPPSVKQGNVKKQITQKNDETNKLHSVGHNKNSVEIISKVNGDPNNENKELDESKNEKVREEKITNSISNQKPSEGIVQNASTDDSESQNATKINHSGKKEVSPANESEVSGAVDEDNGRINIMSRSKISTEEEAKAALAERRRLAREQAEREAEAERLRLELEAKIEAERLKKEEEEQRLAEEEQLRLLDEAKKMEENRLMQAIQEAKKREEEERERQKQEEIARLEKEEAERKAREEAERQRIEMAERLKREEEERQARRKRVEAIMKRTRNNPTTNVNKADGEKGEEDGTEHEKDENKSKLEVFLHGEKISSERSLITNGQNDQDNRNEVVDSNVIGNNHSNGVELTHSSLEKEDCLNSNSTLVTPLIAFQGKAKDTPVAANYMA